MNHQSSLLSTLLLTILLATITTKSVVHGQSSSCDFCGGQLGNIPDPSRTFKIALSDLSISSSTTCESLFILSREGTATCESLKPYEYSCCEALAPPRSCHLCGGDSEEPFNAAKKLTGDITCGDVDDWMKTQDSDSCGSFGPFSSYTKIIDVYSFCECPGVKPPNTCNVCGEGQHVDLTATAMTNDGIPVNCAQGAGAAKYVVDEPFCAELTKHASHSDCCVENTAADAAPATTTTSGVMILSVSSLTATLIVGLAAYFVL